MVKFSKLRFPSGKTNSTKPTNAKPITSDFEEPAAERFTSMYQLPPEVWERITLYLDGRTLVAAKQTCTKWRNIVESTERNGNVWKVRCMTEIDKNLLMDLLGRRSYQKLAAEVDCRFWQRIYVTWHKQHCISDRRPFEKSVYKIDDTNESVDFTHRCICMKTSGNVIITGHASGYVFMWNLSGDLLTTVSKHMQKITDVALVNYFQSNPLLQEQLLSFGTPCEINVAHHHVITAGEDGMVWWVTLCPTFYVSSRSRLSLNATVKNVSVFDDKVVLLCQNGIIQVFQIKLEEDSFDVFIKFIHAYNQSYAAQDIHWIGFWNGKITCIDAAVDRYTVTIKDDLHMCHPDLWTCHPPILAPLCDTVPFPFGDIAIMKCFFFRNTITVLLTVERYLCISADGIHYQLYSTMKDLKSIVTAIHIEANLLALGTNIGRVYIFYFKNDVDLMSLDMGSPVFSSDIFDNAVTAVNIKLDDKEPIVTAASSSCFAVVRFH